jgi:hypothetical protein
VSPLRLPFHANMPAPLAEEHAALASLQQLQQQLEELLADVQVCVGWVGWGLGPSLEECK